MGFLRTRIMGGGIGNRIVVINQTLAAGDITPSTGASVVTNGTMEADSDWINTGTPTTNERSDEQAHGGTYSRKVVGDEQGDGIRQNITVSGDTWYEFVFWLYISSLTADHVYGVVNQLSNMVIGEISTTGSWVQALGTRRATADDTDYVRVRQHGAGASTFYVDDVAIKPITFSSMQLLLNDVLRQRGTYLCYPTVQDKTQCGLLIEYEDDDNFVMMVVDREADEGVGVPDDQAKLLKRVGGTYTEVITGSITYGAGNALRLVVEANGDHTLYYDGNQVGATTGITDGGLGTAVYGFATHADNTPGQVMAALDC